MIDPDKIPVHVLKDNDEPKFAVIEWKDWVSVLEALKQAQHGHQAGEVARSRGQRFEEALPKRVTDRLAAGASPIKVLREWRRLTQSQLAEMVGSSSAYLSQIERGERSAGFTLVTQIAIALEVDMRTILNSKPLAQAPVYNPDRETVFFIASIDSLPRSFSISQEALEDMEEADHLTGKELLRAFTKHKPEILRTAARLVSTGRKEDYNTGAILITTMDMQV